MRKTTKSIRKMCVTAGVLVLSVCANALMTPDTQIMIDRALNSPTLSVRFSGARVALVELRLNGESLGTRAISSTKTTGETNFTLDLKSLKDGDNQAEIRLYDRTGKLVGSNKTNISADQANTGPVFLAAPKMGASVMGPVEIAVGFGKEFKNTYVSFFIDDQFKSLTNFPPFNYLWDTAGETNGWHEVYAMVVDDSSDSVKTRKIRVFVNNPGGRTERRGVKGNDLTPSTNKFHSGIEGKAAGIRTLGANSRAVASAAKVSTSTPRVSPTVIANKVSATDLGGMSGIKPARIAPLAVSGPRSIAPRVLAVVTVAKVNTAPPAKVVPAKATSIRPMMNIRVAKVDVTAALPHAGTLNAVTTAATLIPITRGQKIPNLASLAVVLNNEFVNFDVQPRVDNGVPMTPFRHLIEKAGGKVNWQNMTKSLDAQADGRHIFLQVGDTQAKINDLSVSLEVAPYLERGRTIVPLSFIREALNVNVDFDKTTGHVLITTIKK